MRHVSRAFGMMALLALALMGATEARAATASRLQVLLPGETAAPGTSTGKTGTPRTQTAGVPFSVTIRACDNTWNLVTSNTDVIQTLASDASATLPGPVALSSGQATVTVTLNAGGTFTIYGHDQSDGTIPDGVSSAVQALVLQGFTFSSITQKNQYAGVAQTLTVNAVDPSGKLVSGFSGWVRLEEITSYGLGRCSPDSVQLSGGSWTGNVTCYRADETSINRGNVNFYALITVAPSKNGTSDPFTVHPGTFARVQIVVPGQTPAPGSISGLLGTPSDQSAGKAFTVNVYSTDAYWNPLPSSDVVHLSSTDGAATLPANSALSNGVKAFAVTLNTVGTWTLTASDATNGAIGSSTSPGISVIPSSVDHFAVSTITSPQVAGIAVSVTIRAADSGNNTVPGFNGDANLAANTGPGSITPERVTFTNGAWTGPITFKGAGGNVVLSVSDFSAPPHTGASNGFAVNPGSFTGLQILLPGQTAQGGTATGSTGVPTGQQAGSPFTITLRAVDAYWNMVPGVNDLVKLGSTDEFATMPADTQLVNGQLLLPVTLYRSGAQRIWISDSTTASATPDTSDAVTITGGSFAKVLVLAPGESPAPGTLTGRTGTATDESINYLFNVTVLATDQWWNPVGGVTDKVHLTSDDPLATFSPDTNLVNGQAIMTAKLARGGYDQILVSDVTNPAKGGSSTQVRAITSGFHLQAAVSPATARAGEPFTLTVEVTNDAGSVIQEINSFVTLTVKDASSGQSGKGALLTTQFQLLQGQRTLSETYTFAEPIVIIAQDDAGNAPATSNVITIGPGQPTQIRMASNPSWVGGDKHATVTATLEDAFANGVPGTPITFALVTGTGTLGVADSATAADGSAHVDFLSPRNPETDRIQASAAGLLGTLDLQTAFVDPNAPGGTVTNYPNPFHPPVEGTTFAWKLADNARVQVRIFTQNGDLVLRQVFESGATGGQQGLNTWVWDGRNGHGDVVSSGGYVALIEAQGQGATLNVMRRKVGVVR